MAEQHVRIRMRTGWAGTHPQTKNEKKSGNPPLTFALHPGEDYLVPASLAKILMSEPEGDPRAEPAPEPRPQDLFELRG